MLLFGKTMKVVRVIVDDIHIGMLFGMLGSITILIVYWILYKLWR